MRKQKLSKFTSKFQKSEREERRLRLQKLLELEPGTGLNIHTMNSMLIQHKKRMLTRYEINSTKLSQFDNALFKVVKELEQKSESREYIGKFLANHLAPETHLQHKGNV